MLKLDLKDTLTIFAIVVGRLIGVLLTYFMERKRNRHSEKHAVLVTLLQNRGGVSYSPHEVVKALNSIDVVFVGEKKVLAAWDSYYEAAIDINQSPKRLDEAWVTLLREIASNVGYRKLGVSHRISRFYRPNAQHSIDSLQLDIALQWQRILHNSEQLSTVKRSIADDTANLSVSSPPSANVTPRNQGFP